MLDALVVFSAMPFLFFVTVGFSPNLIIRNTGDIDKEHFKQFSKLAFFAYCIFPIYAVADSIFKIAWKAPMLWTLDNWFELTLGGFGFFLGLYLQRFANKAYDDAFNEKIQKDYPPKKRIVNRTQNQTKK